MFSALLKLEDDATAKQSQVATRSGEVNKWQQEFLEAKEGRREKGGGVENRRGEMYTYTYFTDVSSSPRK